MAGKTNPKLRAPSWFRAAVADGATAVEQGEHGFYTVQKGRKYLTDCDEPRGKLAMCSGYRGSAECGSAPTAKAFEWLFGVKGKTKVKKNPSSIEVGARVQDAYGNKGTVESVPTSRGGSYAVLMDPTGAGVQRFARTALLLRSEIRRVPKSRSR